MIMVSFLNIYLSMKAQEKYKNVFTLNFFTVFQIPKNI